MILRRILRQTVLLLLAALLTGCSGIKLAYTQFDVLAPWYVDDYLPLDESEREFLRERLQVQMAWHCSTQLPGYTAWLRELDRELEAPLTRDALERHTRTIEHYWQTLMLRLTPDVVELLTRANDAQIEYLLEQLHEDLDEYREDYVDAKPKKIQRKRAKRMRRHLERWLEELTPEQNERLAQWSKALIPLGAEGLAYRESRRAFLRSALANREDRAALTRDIRALLAYPERFKSQEYMEMLSINRRMTMDLLVELHEGLESEQRAHMHELLEAYAGDFKELACTEGAPGEDRLSGAQAHSRPASRL